VLEAEGRIVTGAPMLTFAFLLALAGGASATTDEARISVSLVALRPDRVRGEPIPLQIRVKNEGTKTRSFARGELPTGVFEFRPDHPRAEWHSCHLPGERTGLRHRLTLPDQLRPGEGVLLPVTFPICEGLYGLANAAVRFRLESPCRADSPSVL